MLNFAFALFLFFQQSDVLEVSVEPPGKQQLVGDVWTATHNVVVTYQDIRVEADSITYNEKTKDLSAGEHVKFTRGDEHLEGERLELNYGTKAGTMHKVSGYVGPGFYFNAEEVHRYADGHYELINATVTTCNEDKPGWTLQFTKSARVYPGSRVVANGSVFRLQGVPLFYFPYVVVPTTNREHS